MVPAAVPAVRRDESIIHAIFTCTCTHKYLRYRRLRQTTLDAALTERIPPFTREGLSEYLMETVVADHHALSLVDSEMFRRTLMYTRPTLKDGDILKYDELRQKIIEKSAEVINHLRDEFMVSLSRIILSSYDLITLRKPTL
jgi:hypothetical protein